jgi:short-subunit dehydrogenase
MKTAIITGASAGMGKLFAEKLTNVFPDIECVWLIARRADRLEEIGKGLKIKAVSIPLDLTKSEDIAALSRKMDDEKPDVKLLVNNAGCGYLGNIDESDPALLERMVDLNIKALTLVTNAVLPHMSKGSNIINISSIASFCPNPRMTVYSSSKAYVSSFSIGLRDELRNSGISVLAVCPGPMDTEFIEIGGIKGHSKMFNTLPYCTPEKVVDGSLKAAKAGRAFYTPKAFFKFYRFIAHVLPRTITVKLART